MDIEVIQQAKAELSDIEKELSTIRDVRKQLKDQLSEKRRDLSQLESQRGEVFGKAILGQIPEADKDELKERITSIRESVDDGALADQWLKQHQELLSANVDRCKQRVARRSVTEQHEQSVA